MSFIFNKSERINKLLDRIQEQKDRIEQMYHEGFIGREGRLKLLALLRKTAEEEDDHLTGGEEEKGEKRGEEVSAQ
jgi:hypothetical protein